MIHTSKEIKLNNGIRGLLIDTPGIKNVRFSLGFRGGTYFCPADKPEVAHVLEHMVLKANEVYHTEKELMAEFCKNGAYINAVTSDTSIKYIAGCAKFEWERILKLMVLSVTKPLLLEEHFATEIKVVREELAGYLDSYPRILTHEVDKIIDGFDLVPQRRIALLDNVNINDLRRFYADTHFAANMRFVISGDLSLEQDKLERILGDVKFSSNKQERLADFKYPFHAATEPIAIDSPANKIYFRFFVVRQGESEFSIPERADLDVLLELLFGDDGFIYYPARDKGLIYGIQGRHWRTSDDGCIYFYGSVEKGNALRLFELIAKELNKILAGRFSEKAVESIKRRLIGMQQNRELTNAGLISFYDHYIALDNSEAYEHYDDIINEWSKVNKHRIQDTLNSIFDKKHWYLGLLGADVSEIKDDLYQTAGSIFKR